MGNSTNAHKDPNLELHLSIDKPFYYSGQPIHGTVNLVAKDNLSYNRLFVRFLCREYCQADQSGNYHGSRDTFAREIVLAEWPGGLRLGHFSYPFTYQIPPELPGSLMMREGDADARITHTLTASAVDLRNIKPQQTHQLQLTIVQPPRLPLSFLSQTSTAHPKFCCCCSAGPTTLTSYISRNHILHGEPIHLTLTSDNSLCRKSIRYMEIQFIKNMFMQTNSGSVRLRKKRMSRVRARGVRARQYDQIQVQMQGQAEQSTAIGTIVANYYTVRVRAVLDGQGCACCGYREPVVESEVNVQAPPIVQNYDRMVVPPGWDPLVMPNTAFAGDNTFYYQRNPKLVAMNRIM